MVASITCTQLLELQIKYESIYIYIYEDVWKYSTIESEIQFDCNNNYTEILFYGHACIYLYSCMNNTWKELLHMHALEIPHTVPLYGCSYVLWLAT